VDQKAIKRLSIAIVIGFVLIHQSLSILPVTAQTTAKSLNSENYSPKIHEIKMAGVLLPDGHQAYKMLEYKVIDKQNNNTEDITSRYSKLPTIPGPTIVMTEGDQARLTIVNEMGHGQVSLHTHGAHYEITSDGTLKMTNLVKDQGATPQEPYTCVDCCRWN
jgi:FtsP/CotA-like multicopper oxidase with cupredoxin domain